MLKNILLALIVCVHASIARADAPAPVSPFDVVTRMEKLNGLHPGFRRNHAKGICALGEFTATPEARELSRSVLFSGKSVKVVARFSDAGGMPTVPDSKKIPRGLGLQFDLGDSGLHNMSMLNAPIFPAATPEAFYESLAIASPEQAKAFMTKYPESQAFFGWVNKNNPTASYATTSYFSLNAFKFLNAAKKEQFVRWQFVPAAGDVKLTDAELAKADPNYLEKEIKTRLGKAPAQWTMIATLAETGDNLLNATQPWPSTRKTVKMGTLKLASAVDQAGGPCDKVNYDPTRVTDGVEISDDPVLKFRSPAYAISYGKRLSDPVDTKAAPEKK